MKSDIRWIRLAISVIPLLLFFCGINYYEDPANLFHNNSKSVAVALLDGKEAYFGTGNGDERAVKYYTVERLPKHLDCITLGPSLSMGIRSEDVGTESYYNLSVSGMNFIDYMGMIAMLETNGVKYDRIIYCVDSYFFDESFATNCRNEDVLPFTEYMIGLLDGNIAPYPKLKDNDLSFQKKLEQVFSISYFQASMNLVRSNGSFILPEKRWGIIDKTTENLGHYLCDGSWVYARKYRENTVENVISEADSYDIKSRFAYDRHVNEYYTYYFRKLIEHFIDNNVTVEFFLCPVCPALWDRIEADNNHFFLLEEIEECAEEIAGDYGIKIIGSFNPYKVGITNEDYWDARHIKHEMLSEFFDFK